MVDVAQGQARTARAMPGILRQYPADIFKHTRVCSSRDKVHLKSIAILCTQSDNYVRNVRQRVSSEKSLIDILEPEKHQYSAINKATNETYNEFIILQIRQILERMFSGIRIDIFRMFFLSRSSIKHGVINDFARYERKSS
jgi:hypothetical protein